MKIIFTACLAVFVSFAHSQKLKPANTNDFVIECMKTNAEGTHRQTTIWFPYNFWEIVGEQMKSSPEFTQNIVGHMKSYMMFCVVDYWVSGTELSFKSEDEIRSTLKLTDSSNEIFNPLPEQDIDAEAKQLLQHLRPTMAQMFGQFGKGMRIFLFKPKQTNGQVQFNVLKKNCFSLSWDNTRLTWKLPLSSVLPPKFCPVDNEQMKGNWEYCPVHGVKLTN
jgi:hypothetical protein